MQIFTDTGEVSIDLSGRPAKQGSTIGYPYALAFGPQNDLFVIEYIDRPRLAVRFEDRDSCSAASAAPGRGEGQFSTPWGIDVNSKGTIVRRRHR